MNYKSSNHQRSVFAWLLAAELPKVHEKGKNCIELPTIRRQQSHGGKGGRKGSNSENSIEKQRQFGLKVDRK